MNIIEGMLDIYPETISVEKGVAKIIKFELSESEARMGNMHSVMEGESWLFHVKPGKYVKLLVNGQSMMSDTDMERRSNFDFIHNANGHVLIAGLGIGLIIKAIINQPKIKSITVIEKYQDVIDLVGPKFNHPKLKIVCADIFEWLPEPGTKYDTIYFDIWPDICEDNYEEIKQLHARARKYKSDICWVDSWMHTFLLKRVRKSAREARFDKHWHDLFYGKPINLPDDVLANPLPPVKKVV
jgi:hypothetical protein